MAANEPVSIALGKVVDRERLSCRISATKRSEEAEGRIENLGRARVGGARVRDAASGTVARRLRGPVVAALRRRRGSRFPQRPASS